MINKLIALASQLDEMGQHEAADNVDALIRGIDKEDILEYLMQSPFGLPVVKDFISEDIKLGDPKYFSRVTQDLMRDKDLKETDLADVVSAIDEYYSSPIRKTIKDPWESPAGKSITDRLKQKINSNPKFAEEYSKLDSFRTKKEAFDNLKQKNEGYMSYLNDSGFTPYDIYSFYRDILNVEVGLGIIQGKTNFAEPIIKAFPPVLEAGSKVES